MSAEVLEQQGILFWRARGAGNRTEPDGSGHAVSAGMLPHYPDWAI